MQLVEWQNRPRLTKTHFDAFVGVGFLVCSQFYQMVFIASGMKEKSKEKNKRKKAEKESIILEGTWRKSLRGEKRSRRRILRCGREKDLEVALTAKKYEPHALGRAYAGMKFVEKLVAFSKRLTKKTAIFGIKTTYRSVIIAVAIAMVYAANPVALSAPHATTVTFKQDWDKGNLSNINTESSQDSIQLKPTGSWGARVWAPPQDVIAYGHSSAIANGYMYVFRGYSDKAFWRYNIAENKWDTLPDLPATAQYMRFLEDILKNSINISLAPELGRSCPIFWIRLGKGRRSKRTGPIFLSSGETAVRTFGVLMWLIILGAILRRYLPLWVPEEILLMGKTAISISRAGQVHSLSIDTK